MRAGSGPHGIPAQSGRSQGRSWRSAARASAPGSRAWDCLPNHDGFSSLVPPEVALALGARGHSLILVARGQPALEQVAAQIRSSGGRAQTFALDVTDSASVSSTIARVLADGPIDVLVNNAGSAYQAEFLTQPLSRLRE